MMNSEIAKLYSRLNDNADKIENVGTKEEYLQLLANRKSIIKKRKLNKLPFFYLLYFYFRASAAFVAAS